MSRAKRVVSSFRSAVFASGLVMMALWAPPGAQAQNVCNGLLNINYVAGPPWALAGDVYRAEVALGAGTITGGANNELTMDQFRFELDCANFAVVGCPDEGDIIRYVGDGTITSTNCLDAGNNAVTWTTNGVDSPVGPNQVIFTPNNPVVLPASTLPANGCRVEFDIRVQTTPGVDASPTIVQEAAGYDPNVPDATCDNGLSSGASQTGQLFLCPACADDQCFDQACNQTTGNCDQINDPVSTPCEADQDLCTNDHCDGNGSCVLESTVQCQPAVPPSLRWERELRVGEHGAVSAGGPAVRGGRGV
jgi:hypothetical protein